MHRIDHATATASNTFTGGDPTTGVAPTVVTADWLNAVQEEIANAVEGAGLTLDPVSSAQLTAAIPLLAAPTTSLASSGYARFTGGLTLQWGQTTTTVGAGLVVTLPIAFSDACYAAQMTIASLDGLNNGCAVHGVSATSITFSTYGPDGANKALPVYWWAVGK